MPASILSDEPLKLTNVPKLSDIHTMSDLLTSLGCEVSSESERRILTLKTRNITNHKAAYDIVRKMRASILVLGPMLAREGQAVVSLPGGCAIGARPVDLHLKVLEAMGATFQLKDGYIFGRTSGRLVGTKFVFPFVSVGATENALMAATLAKGDTVLKNVAKEPEIIDLAECLIKMGAHIRGQGTDCIHVTGVEKLNSAEHSVIADRIELGTYMLAPVIAGGEVELVGGNRELISTFCQKLEAGGVNITSSNHGLIVKMSDDKVQALNILTEPFPGFPTDLQAQMMAVLCTASGVSVLEERIFENRFMHAPELIRMGADIDVYGGVAKVIGVDKLKGAPVMATDLRASVSLILAGLGAQGETIVSRVYHLDRGYEELEKKLSGCGALIERISE
jgi:UDP-N-acetylglucosamine 1-carboxyvinyltransferase